MLVITACTCTQISGYLDIGSNKHFFFWFFESRSSPKEDLVILWLEGGPACSTMLGVFVAIGYEDMWDDTCKLASDAK